MKVHNRHLLANLLRMPNLLLKRPSLEIQNQTRLLHAHMHHCHHMLMMDTLYVKGQCLPYNPASNLQGSSPHTRVLHKVGLHSSHRFHCVYLSS